MVVALHGNLVHHHYQELRVLVAQVVAEMVPHRIADLDRMEQSTPVVVVVEQAILALAEQVVRILSSGAIDWKERNRFVPVGAVMETYSVLAETIVPFGVIS